MLGNSHPLGLLANETRQGAAPRQRAKFPACEQWAGKAMQKGKGWLLSTREGCHLTFPWVTAWERAALAGQGERARAAQRKAATEILFPGRVRLHCQPHPARLPLRPGLGTEKERAC